MKQLLPLIGTVFRGPRAFAPAFRNAIDEDARRCKAG